MLILSVASIISTRRFVNEAFSARGTIVKTWYGGLYPTIRFTAINSDGEAQEVEYLQILTYGYRVGDQIEILYSGKNPQEACIKRFGTLYGFQIFTTLLGLGIIIFFCLKFFYCTRNHPD
ncbi:MAG: hypothetical protein KatS3mg006_1026 [Pyrinomonadaceae bacterium]|nr:MAG: hypothetical protein KatS3mg006_1026 [Pyrinomonadaceae bacterium]